MSDKRTQLKEAATDAVQRSGLQNLSFRTLADQVGVKSSSVHYYFPEKADLAANIIEGYTDDFLEKLHVIDKKKLSLSKSLDAFVQIFKHVLNANKFCLCGMMAAEVATLNDNNRALLNNYFTKIEDWLTTLFNKHPNDINPAINSLSLSQIVLSGLQGAILLDRVEGTQTRLDAQHKLIKTFIS